jgi:2-(1,2-epoxy-1,2-dihydrophenyl)acetyl-CoA isomerase
MSHEIRSHTSGGVKVVTLNRPRSLNAMNRPLLDGLVAELSQLGDIRAVVLTGAGRAFCAGEDLKQTLAPKTGKAAELRVALNMLQEITRMLAAFEGVVIAAVHGYAVGGGAELALAADIVVAHRETRFRFPETEIGHAVTGGITARLPALVGLSRAKELLLTSRWIRADEACDIGMIAEIAPDPLARAMEIATTIASYSPLSVASAKRGLELGAQPVLEQQLRWEVESALSCFAAPEADVIFRTFGRRNRRKRPKQNGGE